MVESFEIVAAKWVEGAGNIYPHCADNPGPAARDSSPVEKARDEIGANLMERP